MIEVRITEEAYFRAENIIREIGYAVDVNDSWEEWYDVASEVVTAGFEDLNDIQVRSTYSALMERISEKDENLSDGIRNAVVMSFEETIDYKDDFISQYELYADDDDDDVYDTTEAKELRTAFSECLEDIKEEMKNV